MRRRPNEGTWDNRSQSAKPSTDRLGLAVPSDDGRLASCGLIHHRREVCLGIFQLNLSHGVLHMTIVVMHISGDTTDNKIVTLG